MSKAHNIFEELRQIAPAVANLGNNNPYTVPMGYFNELPKNILQHINGSGKEIALSKSQTYGVPAGYFDDLANTILYKINLAKIPENAAVSVELHDIAPLLNEISKENILTVPVGYFEAFHVGLPKAKKQATVISFGNNIRNWLTYAVAASVLFILSSSSYLYINQHMRSVDKSPTIGQRLANLDDEEIINYLKNDPGDFDANPASSVEPDPDINHLLINAPDAEIERYLDVESDPGEEIIKGI